MFKLFLMLVVLLTTDYCLLTTGVAADSGGALWHGNRNLKEAALTFDDGPREETCDRILDILDETGVRATFFLVGQEAEQNPDLVMRIGDSGHDLGNHSYSHINLTKISSPELAHELNKTNEIISHITGRAVHLLRLPGGAGNVLVAKAAKELGLKVINWSLNTGDYVTIKSNFQIEEDYVELTQELVLKVLDETKPGDIILFHNGSPQTVNALPSIIQGLKEKGYRFVTISQMLEHNEVGYGDFQGIGEE
jgi:peptidoglycan/xylan/chitin deacetylase (PgdA/CDA1 family)